MSKKVVRLTIMLELAIIDRSPHTFQGYIMDLMTEMMAEPGPVLPTA